MKRLLLAFVMLGGSAFAQTVVGFNGQCSTGAQSVLTQNQTSKGTMPIGGGPRSLTSGVIASYPRCQVTVYLTGTITLAPIFSDTVGTPLLNPFTANTDGSWLFFANPSAGYDITTFGAGMPSPVTLTDVNLGGGGGGGGPFAPLNSPVFVNNVNLSWITGAVQCLHVDALGNITGTGLDCGSGGGGAVSSVFTRTGAVVATTGDYTVAQVTGAAPLASPTFTGTVNISGIADGCALFVGGAFTSTGTGCGATGGMVWPSGNGIPVVSSTGPSWGTTLGTSGTGSVALTASPTFTGSPVVPGYVPTSTTVNSHALSSNVTVTASDVGLGSLTNDAQTKASIVPNTGLVAGKILVVNAGATAYAPVAVSGDSTLSSTGVVTNVKVNGGAIPASATCLGTNGSTQLVNCTVQGNASKVQLSTGTTSTGAVGIYDVNGNLIASTGVTVSSPGYNALGLGTNLFASLPACSSGVEGKVAAVTNSTTATWGATISGGGSNHVLAYCDGTNWTVMGS